MDPDPYVFLPTGSGSVIICADQDPSINKQKKVRKTSTILSHLFGFLSLTAGVNVHSRNNEKNLLKNLFFVGILSVTKV